LRSDAPDELRCVIRFLVGFAPTQKNEGAVAERATGAGVRESAPDFTGINATEPPSVEAQLQTELSTHGDLLLLPVEDRYRHVVLKTLHFLDWAVGGGGGVIPRGFHFLVKTDDDTVLDLGTILPELAARVARRESRFGSAGVQRVYRGLGWTGAPIRARGHKNFLSPRAYPLKVFAPYAHGAGYILSQDLVEYIVENERLLKFSLVSGPDEGAHEDTLIGLWMFAAGIRVEHDSRFSTLTYCRGESIALFDVPDACLESVGRDVLARATAVGGRAAAVYAPDRRPRGESTAVAEDDWRPQGSLCSPCVRSAAIRAAMADLHRLRATEPNAATAAALPVPAHRPREGHVARVLAGLLNSIGTMRALLLDLGGAAEAFRLAERELKSRSESTKTKRESSAAINLRFVEKWKSRLDDGTPCSGSKACRRAVVAAFEAAIARRAAGVNVPHFVDATDLAIDMFGLSEWQPMAP
jgi:hypothetical protein